MRLEPGSWLAWILLGLLAGWIAGLFTAGRGFGCLGNITVGLAGAVIGGWLFSLLGVGGVAGFRWSLLVAIVGAALLLTIVNLVRSR